jgi:cytochrome oxidase Cu insertion factor (SCO1/SenC/PrrC family)
MKIVASAVLTVTLGGIPSPAGAHDVRAHGAPAVKLAGEGAGYAFPLPEPGSYRLPPIRPAGDGTVLDETGQVRRLAPLLRGRVTVLAFVYTRCGDVCPTATLQMSRLQDLAAKDGRLRGRLQLATMSFDPDHDTPAVMAEQARQWRSGEARAPAWHFLTAPDRATLAPMLAAYDQSVAPKPAAEARTGPLFHLFRAFLIDSSWQVRNIYSLDFLDPDLVLNDARTLLLESASTQPGPGPAR